MRFRTVLLAMMAALVLFGSVGTSQAVLNAVDPGPYTLANGFFPAWYSDTNGRGLDLCLSPAVGVNGPLCIVLADAFFDPTLTLSFPTNWPGELFYFVADGLITAPGINKLVYRAALEASFATGAPINGDQIVFARVRVRADAPVAGQYTITHPYGVLIVNVDTPGSRAINVTIDAGLAALVFTDALGGDIGPFLQATGGPITGDTGELFIGDPNITQTVTGSPFGTNFVRIVGPVGSGVDFTTDQFTVSGKITAATTPTPLIVDRTTYSRTASQTQVDVFATSAPTATASFADGATTTPMVGDAVGRFFGQELNPAAIPASVTVTAANVGNLSTSIPSNVTDVVSITKVEYSAGTGTLVIEASSSDESPLPALSFGASTLVPTGVGTTQSFTVTGLAIPPATVTVTSANGGSDTEEVVVLP